MKYVQLQQVLQVLKDTDSKFPATIENHNWKIGFSNALHVAKTNINKLEAVEIQSPQHICNGRCKNCAHKGWIQEPEHVKSIDFCRILERPVDENFYCAAWEDKITF